MNTSIRIAFILFAAIALTSCIKEKSNVVPTDKGLKQTDDHNPDAKAGKFEMHFHNMVGNQELNLGTTWYTTQDGDSFQVSLFNYYISNIVLTRKDGSKFVEPNSYHIITQNNAADRMFNVEDVPAGEYTSVSFMIGVDEARNTSGGQTGALDPAYGMFWDINTGYIMAKLEGIKASSDKLSLHIGGFKGDNNVLKTVSLDFAENKKVDNNTMHVHVKADVRKWFIGQHEFDLATMANIDMPGPEARKIADNYVNMFSLN